MVIGLICAVVAGGVYPLMFIMYGNIGNALVDFQKLSTVNHTALLNLTVNLYFKSNIELLRQGIDGNFSMAIINNAASLTYVIIALVYAWKLALVLIVIIPLIAISAALMYIMTKKYKTEELKAYENTGSIAQSVLGSIKTVYAFSLQKYFIKKYTENLTTVQTTSSKKGFFVGLFNGCVESLFISMEALLSTLYSVYLLQNECETYNVSNIMVAFFCMLYTTFTMGTGLAFLSTFSQAKIAGYSVYELLNYKSSIDSNESGKELKDLKGDIHLKDVSFNYPQRDDTRIINSMTLHIPANKTIAFCGSNGCGKSTIVQLIQRFYDPTEGCIEIDGHNLKK